VTAPSAQTLLRLANENSLQAGTLEKVLLFALSAGEAAFLDGVLDRGEIDPSGLGGAPEIQARIAAMPMLAWKCQNVRAHRGGI
jgi:hypothetical protein